MPTLADIEPNRSATIVAIEGEDEISMRLMEMGLIEGDEIQVVGRAPMGDPIEIAARGYRLSLRRAEAMRVQVFPAES